MKKLLFAIWSMLFVMAIQAQQADMRVGELINRSDWFSLEEEYPVLKDSIQADFLKLLAEAMLATNFNQPDRAIECIGQLMAEHQGELGFGNIQNLVTLASSIDWNRGNYARSADGLKDFISGVKAAGMTEDIEPVANLYEFFNQFRDLPSPALTRPDKDVEVAVSIEKVKLPTSVDEKGWRGTQILMPVTVHGKEYHFIFDTGAGTTYMSERFAKEVGVSIVKDSFLINGGLPGASYGMLGYLDSLQVGEMTFHNAKVTIARPNAMDSVLQVDAILGIDFMNLTGEFQIYPKEGKVVFPLQSTRLPATGRNLMMPNGCPVLKAYSGNDLLKFIFDTGCTTGELYYPYYQKYKDRLDSIGKKDSGIGGGFNFIEKKEMLRIPSATFSIGDIPVEISDISVSYVPVTYGGNEDGILGMSLVNLFRKVTVNLKDMFVTFE